MTGPLRHSLLAALLLSSCVRFEVESEDELGSAALRLSSTDAVVLCPLSAIAEPAGTVSIVWAGYPPADDRLQLMHARVSDHGELVQAPHALAELESELDALSLSRSPEGVEVQVMQRGVQSSLTIELAEQSWVGDESSLPADLATVAESCQARVQTSAGSLRIYRGQEDGELALFALPDEG